MPQPPVRLVIPGQDDAGHLAGWYLLNVHLQRTLGLASTLEPSPSDDDFEQLFGERSLIVLANAHQTLRGIEAAGWCPVARPVRLYDELLVLARRDGDRLAGYPVRVACASEHSWLPRMGAETLERQGLLSADCEIRAWGSDAAAIQSLLQGNSDLALLDRRAWSGLGPALRDQLYRVTESHSQRCFSTLCVSRDLATLQGPLLELLEGLPAHATGKHLFTDLGFPGFEAVPEAALAALRGWLFEAALV